MEYLLAVLVVLIVYGWFGSHRSKKCLPKSAASRSSRETIIGDYGALMEKNPPIPTRIEDAALLPHPKQDILDAICVTLADMKDPKMRSALRQGAITLAQFQPGVGPKPLHMFGIDRRTRIKWARSEGAGAPHR